jgi:hypothetical protein
MSQNVWATIMPFGPVTLNFLLAQENFFLISGTGLTGGQLRNLNC